MEMGLWDGVEPRRIRLCESARLADCSMPRRPRVRQQRFRGCDWAVSKMPQKTGSLCSRAHKASLPKRASCVVAWTQCAFILQRKPRAWQSRRPRSFGQHAHAHATSSTNDARVVVRRADGSMFYHPKDGGRGFLLVKWAPFVGRVISGKDARVDCSASSHDPEHPILLPHRASEPCCERL
ncbi:hypothetical protein P171DRAFT_180920 [Karstenula rhodostoma CBS 690.94]|uniref:Uncharacterized protein n=1 Tax=Karstenula rhodostoma CBS 690.94 TaxID=1392251 RepID=A0A9P4P5N7_9PLEO|nr:hypothetical protein P171DRAFT_180920 [Karstenula rhodostoma CBS 690.94]